MQNFIKEVKIIQAGAAAVAGTAQVNSAIVDTAGFDGICWLVHLGVVTSGSVITVTTQDSGDNATTNMAVVGTNVAITDAGAFSNTVIASDLVNVQKRYQRCIVKPATQNAAISAITALLYRSKSRPVTQDTTVSGSGLVNATS